MMMLLRSLLALLLVSGPAIAQVGQIPSATVWGNPTAARAPATPATITAMFDRAFTTSRGSIIQRGASAWAALAPGTVGLPLVSGGAGADVAYAILGLSGGGTAAALVASNGGIVYSGASALAILSGTATAGQMLRSGASGAPSWSTATWPATIAQGDLLFGSSINVVGALTKSTSATRYLSNTGTDNAPAWALVDLSNGVTGVLPVANGGTNCSVASGTCLDNITGFSSTGIVSRTGAGAYSFSTLTALMDSGLCSTRGNVIYRGAASWSCLPNGTSGQLLQANGVGSDPTWVTAAGSGTVTSVAAGTGMSFTTITTTGSVAIDKASAAQFEAGTADKVLTADTVFTAETTTTYGTTTTLDFNTFINTRVTLTGNITTLTCSNMKASQSGTVTFVQDGTGSRTMVAGWCSVFRWAGGARGVLSTAINAIDALFYTCISTTVCYVSLGKAQAN